MARTDYSELQKAMDARRGKPGGGVAIDGAPLAAMSQLLEQKGWRREAVLGGGDLKYENPKHGRIFIGTEGWDHKDAKGMERGYGSNEQDLAKYLGSL